MHSDYWVKWIVVEKRVEEEVDRARHRALVEQASSGSWTPDEPGWWRTIRLSIAAVGRGWMAEPATIARAMETSTRLSANEGFGAY